MKLFKKMRMKNLLSKNNSEISQFEKNDLFNNLYILVTIFIKLTFLLLIFIIERIITNI